MRIGAAQVCVHGKPYFFFSTPIKQIGAAQVRVRGVCAVTKSAYRRSSIASSSSTTAAAFQALTFVPVVTVCVCVFNWCTAKRSNRDNVNTFTSNAPIERTPSDLMPGMRRIQQKRKQ